MEGQGRLPLLAVSALCVTSLHQLNIPSPPSHHFSRQEKAKGGFHPEVDEEFEDAQGNVYNRKTYEDLKRQGLI